jgi:hypothetical protein
MKQYVFQNGDNFLRFSREGESNLRIECEESDYKRGRFFKSTWVFTPDNYAELHELFDSLKPKK